MPLYRTYSEGEFLLGIWKSDETTEQLLAYRTYIFFETKNIQFFLDIFMLSNVILVGLLAVLLFSPPLE